MKNVLFVCRGNAFRSIIAEAYLNSLELPNVVARSRGTVASQYKQINVDNFAVTLDVLASHGIGSFAKRHYAEDLDQASLAAADVVVCLNRRVYLEAKEQFVLPNDVRVWNVTDVGEPGRIANSRAERVAHSEEVFKEISKQVLVLTKELKQ